MFNNKYLGVSSKRIYFPVFDLSLRRRLLSLMRDASIPKQFRSHVADARRTRVTEYSKISFDAASNSVVIDLSIQPSERLRKSLYGTDVLGDNSVLLYGVHGDKAQISDITAAYSGCKAVLSNTLSNDVYRLDYEVQLPLQITNKKINHSFGFIPGVFLAGEYAPLNLAVVCKSTPDGQYVAQAAAFRCIPR